MEEEASISLIGLEQEPFLCKCFLENVSKIAELKISPRKDYILNVVTRTENYLKERRIPELMRFLLTKVVAQSPAKPIAFLEKLLLDCMLFRAGHGLAPTLYEERHLEAVIRSFDPGQRGWLSAGQVRRLYATLGFVAKDPIDDKVDVINLMVNLKRDQENILFQLLSAGIA